jgi:hypothetical protein
MGNRDGITSGVADRNPVLFQGPHRGPGGQIPDRRDEPDRHQAALDALAKIGDFRIDGLVWVLSCNDQQTKALQGVLASLGSKLTIAAGPLAPKIAVAITLGIGHIQFMNELGGDNGVDINGVVDVPGLIVTPRMGPLASDLMRAARLGVSGRVITEFLANAAAKSPVLATTYQLGGVAAVVKAIQSGTPLGWALAGAVGLVIDLLTPAPDPNSRGAVHADRNAIGPWETFTLGTGGNGSVSLLSWLGHFSADGAGGAGVYANRPEVLPWETWTLVDNGDGTVSFRTLNGHYLCAENGGGRECQANRGQIGAWEKFRIVMLPSGQIALQAHNGQFVSVQD